MTIYTLDIQIGRLRLPAVEVAADNYGDDIILGRNLLNKLVLTLNGPRRFLEILG